MKGLKNRYYGAFDKNGDMHLAFDLHKIDKQTRGIGFYCVFVNSKLIRKNKNYSYLRAWSINNFSFMNKTRKEILSYLKYDVPYWIDIAADVLLEIRPLTDTELVITILSNG